MYPYYYGWHSFGFAWLFPLIILIMLIACVFRGPGWMRRHRDRRDGRETPREILDRRYASGELTKEQYEEMKRTLLQ
jgi:putative membrane protein